MTFLCFMSVITIIPGFSCQIPASGKPLNLVYVLSLLSDLFCEGEGKPLRNKVLLNAL